MTPDTIPPAAALTPAMAAVLIALASGKSVSAAARAAHINRTTIYHWLDDHEGFRASLQQLRRDQSTEVDECLAELGILAVKAIRRILTSDTAPPSVVAKLALAILKESPSDPNYWNVPLSTTPLDRIDKAKCDPSLVQPVWRDLPPRPAPPQDIDLDLLHIATPAKPVASGRNAPCPCGSNLKFKRCCGRPEAPRLAS